MRSVTCQGLFSAAGIAVVGLLCMGAGFTHVSSGDSSVDKDIVNELRTAHRERAWAAQTFHTAGWKATNFVGGEIAHDDRQWANVSHGQSGLQSNLVLRLVPAFVNHTIAITNTNTVVMWTIPAWQQETGLTNAGVFRRLTDASLLPDPGTNWLYGIAQPGDIVGSWLWEDLQAGYSALKWTKDAMGVGDGYYGSQQLRKYGYEQGYYDTPSYDSCTEIYDIHASEYANDWAAKVGSPGKAYYVRVIVNSDFTPYVTNVEFRAERICASIYSGADVPTNNAHSTDVYWLFEKLWGDDFYDIDDLGLTYGNYWLFTNIASVVTNHMYVGAQTNLSENPVDIMGFDCSVLTAGETDIYLSAYVKSGFFIYKWDFSNSD